jgi:signal peptidase I
VAIILATFARTFVAQAFEIPSASMEPDLQVGDHLLVNKFVFTPWGDKEIKLLPERAVRRGDVVVFKFPRDPQRDFIKRCVGLPGDVVEIVRKQLFVNGHAVDESRYAYHGDPRTYPRSMLLPEEFSRRDNYGPYSVPEGELFCLGDNRDNSNDSRFWGPVPRRFVKGRALLIYWSLNVPPAPRHGLNMRQRARRLFGILQHLVQNTRWDRTFRLVR